MRTVVYIDDQEDSRTAYQRQLRRIYGHDEFDVIAVEPKGTIEEMVELVFGVQNLISIVIDERLNVTGVANYLGAELASAIRDIDSKIPVYILTSFSGDLESLLGTVEFVIDKNDMSIGEKRSSLSERMRRHVDTFRDICSARGKRLNELLIKSIDEELSDEELLEFQELNFFRMKKILLEEQPQSERLKKQLDKQEELLAQIENKLNQL